MQHKFIAKRTVERRIFLLAVCLAAVAGCADAVAYLTMKGFFASFMSGNATRLAIGLASGDVTVAGLGATLIAGFVLGVVAGRVIGRPQRIMAVVATLMVLAAFLATLAPSGLGRAGAIAVLVPALGAMNNVVQRAGPVSITATYITGTLVRLGQALGTAILGGARWDWLPYALLWLGLMLGGVCGALLFPHAGLATLWLPAMVCVILACLREAVWAEA